MFPQVRHDDQVDALSGAYAELAEGENPSPAVGDLRAEGVRRRDVLGGLIHEYRAAA